MRADTPCPKCGAKYTWYDIDETHQTASLRCLCGLNKLVYSVREGVVVRHTVAAQQVALPRPNTKLMSCLSALALYHPRQVTTRYLSQHLKESSADVASRLMVLMHKGLIEKTTEGRGVAGGSTWKLTNSARNLLHLT